MEDTLHFDRLAVSESPGETLLDDEGREAAQDYSESATAPVDLHYGGENDGLDRLFGYSQMPDDLNEPSYMDIEMNTNQDEYFERQYIHASSSTTSDEDDPTGANGVYPKNSLRLYGLNQWSPHRRIPSLHIRNEARPGRTRDVFECATRWEDLFTEDPFLCANGGERLWYHATSWSFARGIIIFGPKLSEDPSDLAHRGGFYVNPHCPNCYEWLYRKRGSFGGEHAILIFKLNPWLLSNDGEELDEKEWENVVYKRNTEKCHLDWSYAPQNADPKGWASGRRVQACRRSDGEIATQLVIRSERMCQKLHSCLVGCIFFEKTNGSYDAPFLARPVHRSDNSRHTKRSRNKGRSKPQGSKRSRLDASPW